MSSAGGVEAFLAAKWKYKKSEMENGLDLQQRPAGPTASSSKPQNPTATKAHKNTSPRSTDDFSAMQELQKQITIIPNKQGNSFTRTVIVKQLNIDEVASKTINPLNRGVQHSKSTGPGAEFESERSNKDKNECAARGDDEIKEEDIYEENIEAVEAQPCNEFSNEAEEGSTIIELTAVNIQKENQYEMIGDVWGLLEQQNDDIDKEDEPEFEAQAAEEEKPAEPVDMVFGALNSKDVEKISILNSKPKSNTKEQNKTASLVPQMVIPLGNFGKLLEQPDGELTAGTLIPKKLYDKGILNNTTQQSESTEITLSDLLNSHTAIHGPLANEEPLSAPQKQKATRRVKKKHQQSKTKPRLATTTQKNTKQMTQLGTEEAKPDSSTKVRQTPPNSGARTDLGPQSEIMETNQKPPDATNSMVIESATISTFDPELGPVGHTLTNSPSTSDHNPDMVPISRFKVVDSLSKKLVYNVVTYFQHRKRRYDLNVNELQLASKTTGMPKSMITKIMTEAHESILQYSKPTFSEGNCRKMTRRKCLEPNVKRDCIARMFIHNSYLIKKEVPTLKKIIKNSQENGFEKFLGTSTYSVKAHLKKLGFEYNARSGTKTFLLERPDFIAQRIRYLEEMQEHRAQRRNIIFVFVADMLKKGVRNVEWESWDGVFHENEQGIDMNCVSVLHAASGAYVFHDCMKIIDYDVNSFIETPQKPFIHWLMDLLQKAPKGSVIVLGDQKFHQMVDADKRPHVGWTKGQISGWLKQHNVQSDDSWPKALLLEQVQKVVLDQKYVIDDDVTALGHIPVHMPSHHRDLNPLSFIWQDIKDKLDNTPFVCNHRSLRNFVKEEFTKAATKLGKAWTQVEKLEKSYYNIDIHTDDEKEALILRYGKGLVPIENEAEMLGSDNDDEEPPSKVARPNPS